MYEIKGTINSNPEDRLYVESIGRGKIAISAFSVYQGSGTRVAVYVDELLDALKAAGVLDEL